MSAEDDDVIIRYNFTGEDGEIVPRDATHVTVDKSVQVIPARGIHSLTVPLFETSRYARRQNH
jgi:hypothetical protein